jgi:hypothetical protein
MGSIYRHTQTGQLMSWAIVLTAIGIFIAGHVAGKEILFLPIAAILGGVGWIFSSLTVEVTATELIWFFGPGFWRKSIERDAVTQLGSRATSARWSALGHHAINAEEPDRANNRISMSIWSGFGRSSSPPTPMIPPANGKQPSTIRRMVTSAVCHQARKQGVLGRFVIKVEGLRSSWHDVAQLYSVRLHSGVMAHIRDTAPSWAC